MNEIKLVKSNPESRQNLFLSLIEGLRYVTGDIKVYARRILLFWAN